MNPKQQFKSGAKPRSFFDRKVRIEGHSRVVALGKVIPQGWDYVRLTIVSKSENHVTVRIKKLLGAENTAPTKNPNKKRKQNT